MQKTIKNFLLLSKKEIRPNLMVYIILLFSFLVGLFLRVYRLDDLLGFYYDQGRDALVIWKLWHEGKPFLIGPVTGLHGIFLGPLYYYLIAPFYLLGGGSPVVPAIFLSSLSAMAILAIYWLGKSVHSRITGLIAAVIASYSYYIIYNSRWFSNPNPMLLLSTVFFGSLWKLVSSKNSKWVVVATLTAGVSLHFESASAVFYLPILATVIIWYYQLYELNNIFKLLKNKKEQKIIVISLALFIATLLPQLVFNLRHENILLNNFLALFVEEKSFKSVTVYILTKRVDYFWTTFTNKIWPGNFAHKLLFLSIPFAAIIVKRKSLKENLLKLFSIFFVIPVVGYTLFQGNHGNIYDYYLIGYYLPFILLVSLGLAEFAKTWTGKAFLTLFIFIFIQNNSHPMESILKNTMDGPTNIKLGSQVRAVDWVINDAVGRGKFNLHIYVPPVIPYAYDYLYLWKANKICGENLCGKVEEEVPLIYTIYEQDPPHPERLEEWMNNQNNIGSLQEEQRYGGITVERRLRHSNKI